MRIYGDYHTHTKSSDGHGSMEENVLSARQKGLKEVGITNHGFKHFKHGVSKKQFFRDLEEVKRLREKYTDINILYGIEANLISRNGDIDLDKSFEPYLDYVVVGYHKMFWCKLSDFFLWLVPNTFRIGQASKKRIDKNTESYIKMMQKYDIAILAHLNYGKCTVDVKKVAEVAGEKNIFVELNGKRILFSDSEIDDVLDTKADFIISSDAHYPQRVGVCDAGITFITRDNIPVSRVANMDKCPKLNKFKENK